MSIKYVKSYISDTEAEYVDELEFAGVSKDDVKAEVNGDVVGLTINWRGNKYNMRLEYPGVEDFSGTKVKVENGLITVRVPKTGLVRKEIKLNVE